jgi:FKBP-type peptidyl-prolyl cis-trans isomerase FklB
LRVAVLSILVVMVFFGCDNRPEKAVLRNDIDSLSYAVGVVEAQDIRDYLRQQGVDSMYINEFIKGLYEGAKSGDDKKKDAYIVGLQVGQQLANGMMSGLNREVFQGDSSKSVSLNNLLAGFVSGVTGRNMLISYNIADTTAHRLITSLRDKNTISRFAHNKVKSERYMAAMEQEDGIHKLKGGVLYRVITTGNGSIPSDTSKVTITTECYNIDGDILKEKTTQVVDLSKNTIPGLVDAITHMTSGSEWEVYIPWEKAFSNRTVDQIPPYSALRFKIRLK